MRSGLLRAVLGIALVALLAACGAAPERQGGHQPPRDGAAGLQLTGTFAGRQLALSDGAPNLLVGDACVRRVGVDGVCFRSRDIDGTAVTVMVLNPAVIAQGTRVAVADDGCGTAEACAEVRETAVVDVIVGDERRRARDGELRFRQVFPGSRYAGALNLGFRDGTLTGAFDVVPRPES